MKVTIQTIVYLRANGKTQGGPFESETEARRMAERMGWEIQE